MNGRKNTAMPAWNASFNKDDAAGMIDWLMDWKNTVELTLSLDEVKKRGQNWLMLISLLKNIQWHMMVK